MAQLVKNPPAMQETWVQSLGWEDPLEKGKATHSNILQYSGMENSMDCIVHGVAKSRTQLSNFHFTSLHFICIYVYVYGYNIINGMINFLVLHFHSSSQLISFQGQPNIQLGSENSLPSTKMTKYQSKILVTKDINMIENT